MPYSVCENVFSVSMTNRVTKGEGNDETEDCWWSHYCVRDCMVGSDGAHHLRPMEPPDASDLSFSRHQLLAGAWTLFAEPRIVRPFRWPVEPSSQSSRRPRLE